MKSNSIIFKAYKRILNGLAIKYSLDDLFNYVRFLFARNVMIKKTLDSKNFLIKIIVISLPFRIDRRKFIVEQFTKLNIPFEFFDAIHGKSDYNRLKNETYFSKNSLKYLSKGSLGCIESHISNWRGLVSSDFEAFLIFEDDVIINKSYKELLKIINTIPRDFDIVYFGSGSYKNRLNAKSISDNLFVPFSIRKGAYSYLISKSSAKQMLQDIYPIKITCGGIDTILGVLTMKRKITTYHLKPAICQINYKLPSNIYNSSVANKVLHKIEKS